MTKLITSIEPATGQTLWQGPVADVGEEVAIACAAWASWAALPVTVRIEVLRRFANVVRSRADALAELVARETGRPLWDAADEVSAVIRRVEMSVLAWSERTPQKRMEGAMGARAALRHKPHGALGVIGSASLPAETGAGHIIPALLAGNAILYKPSEKTPASGEALLACFHDAGVPEGVARLVQGDGETGQALAGHPDIAGVLFTGRTSHGLELHRRFAGQPDKLLALQMSSNNPLIVWDMPDLETAATLIIQSAFLSSGQRCLAARRLIVEEGMHAPLMEAVTILSRRLIVGAPLDKPQPFMGPLIDNDAAENVSNMFMQLMMRGGRPLLHMSRPDPDLPFLTPGVIDVTNVAQRPDEECFGPMLQLVRAPDFESAIQEANTSRHGLSATLISRSPELYEQFWANVQAGVINWNRPATGGHANVPIGGAGLSGNFRPGGFYAADYCAYPVASLESEQLRASIGVGVRDV